MKIQLRRDTAANWTANDPILLHGEVGIETDTLKIKFGDGVSAWSALGYLVAAASPGGGEGYIQYNNAGSIDGDPQITWNDTTNTLRVSGAISGAAISGGAIRGNWIGNQITSSYIIGYIASTNATGRFADSSNIRLRFPASVNIYNRSWVDTFSSNIDTRIDSLFNFSSNADELFLSSGVSEINELVDVDTKSTSPTRDQVLKWNGTNWVPAAYDDTFVFSITSFSDGESTTQLIGVGEWKAIDAMSFTASYENGPPDTTWVSIGYNTTDYDKSGSIGEMDSPNFTAGSNTVSISYPKTRDQYLRFSLSSQTGSDTDTYAETAIYFRNYIYYGTTSEASGWDTSDIVNLKTSGPTTTYISNYTITGSTDHYILFAHPASYTSLHVSGMIFNSVICPFEEAATVSVTNTAGYTENYKVYRSTLTNLGNSTLTTSTSNTKINRIYYGGSTKASTYTESDIEGLDTSEVTNDQTQTWDTITLDASEYFIFAMPARLSTPTFKDNDTGFEAAFLSPETVSVTNVNGQVEDYSVFRSEQILGPGSFTLLTE